MTLPSQPQTIELAVEAVAALLPRVKTGEFRLIDCREEDEWRICRLPEARLVPLSNFTAATADLIENPLPTIVYCHHGMRSLRAVRWLRSRGLTNAWSMNGGTDAWSDRIDPEVSKY